MENDQVYDLVSSEISKWTELQRRIGVGMELTPGGKAAISQMIVNLKEDPSPFWRQWDINTDLLQEYAISIIPNVLNEIFLKYSRRHIQRPREMIFSSWEIWHGISEALDSWCPVSKDI